MLVAKNVDYEIEYIRLKNQPQWFLEISPLGQAPVLITEDGEPIHESDAIVEYIDEVTAPLIQGLTPVQRAKDRAWSYLASNLYIAQCFTMQSADKETLKEKMADLSNSFNRIEERLGDGPFFNGEKMGNVDIAWFPLLHRAQLVKDYSGYDMFSEFPKVSAWQKIMMKQTDLVDRTVSEDFLEKFSKLYLANETFLGRGADFSETYVPMAEPRDISNFC